MDSNKLVWLPDDKHGFCIGRLVDISQTKVTCQPIALPSSSSIKFDLINDHQLANQLVEFPYKSVYPCDHLSLKSLKETQMAGGVDFADVDDSCALIQLHEAGLLENVRVRFHRDKIYTYVAHILIAVNPYFEIRGLHSPEAIRNYQGKSLGTMPPHVFAIADKAFRDMKAYRQSQSIIISGESGAGKTESQKYVLGYLCLSGTQSGRLEKLILDANPLLEAFGNAKTIRNNNSSRFGKFIEIHYSSKFTVTGGLFFHYLLEKSRICTQSPGERNYHIFYQLCACLPTKQWQQLELGPPDTFHYLNQGCTQYFLSSRQADDQLARERKSAAHLRQGAIQDQIIDDLKCYEQTDRALSNFGLGEKEKFQIYSIVAAVLHLGNIQFCDDPEDSRGGCKIAGPSSSSSSSPPGSNNSEHALEVTSRLIGLDKDLLRQALVTRIMSTARGGHKGTVYMVQLTCQQAQAARDALAKAIYSKLFDYIVTKIVNKSIPFSDSSYYIGVLDVAGFEYFQHNSFEQFLINFCNEKLQQFFNERILKEEQMIYEKEGLNLDKVDYIDNQDCIQLFEQKSLGIFDLLDEESRLPKPSYEHFTQSVHTNNKKHFRLALPRTSKLRIHREIRDTEGFLIRHFAGAVCYETSSFIEKNNDALHASLKSLMLEADNQLLRELFSNDLNDSQSTTYQTHANNHNQMTTGKQHSAGGMNGSALVNFSSGPTTVATSSNKLNFVSVGTTFRSQLNELMNKLRSTGSHFIRCIKPNSEMVAHKFEGTQILSQLHCSGMDSVLKLMQQGYPSRASFNDLYQAYRCFLPPELARLDSHLFCRALFKAIGLNDGDFRFGSSKVFFRSNKFAEFDQIIRTSDSQQVAQLIKKVSKWLLHSRWRKAQYCCLSVIKLHNKIAYRREIIIRLQKNWRAAIVTRQVRFKLQAIRSCRQINETLVEFEQIAEKQLKQSSESKNLIEESHLLRSDVDEFKLALRDSIQRAMISLSDGSNRDSNSYPNINNNNNNNNGKCDLFEATRSKADCEQKLDLLRTKRDLLVRSIKDKLAKQKELNELERKMAEDRKRHEAEEIARRRDEELKRQRNELELRRQMAEATIQTEGKSSMINSNNNNNNKTDSRRLVDSATDPISGLFEDQEQRDYEIALRLAQDSSSSGASNGSKISPPVARPLAPSENLANVPKLDTKYDLTKWKYSDLRDTINTSCDLELLEACKREFHRRLKVYHAWRAMNSRKSVGGGVGGHGTEVGQSVEFQTSLRAPSSVMNNQSADDYNGGQQLSSGVANEQRYFRIPFLRNATSNSNASSSGSNNAGQTAMGQRGWWFAHFDGQWIARQLELHPNREPILLVAGQHDIDMCELSLDETRLTSKRGAEILAEEFEAEWAKHGGQSYRQIKPMTGVTSGTATTTTTSTMRRK